MVVEGGAKCIKYLVFFFNFLFLILGIALLGFGIYAEIKFGPYVDISSVDYASGSRMLIAVGAIITVISFFGCCGAVKENKCLLVIFFILLVVLLGLEIAAAVLGYQNKNKIESDLKNDIKKNIEAYPKNEKAVDSLQKDLKCCGATGPSDWILNTKTKLLPPASCKCDIGRDGCAVSAIPPGTYYKAGCADALKTFLNDKLVVISALAIALLVIQILGMVFAMVLICRIHKGTYA